MLELRYPCQTCGQTHTIQLTCTLNEAVAKTVQQAPLALLGLRPRVYNALLRAGVETIAQLLAMTDGDLLDVRLLGGRGLHDVRTQLVVKGFLTVAEAEERWGPWP